MELFKLESGLYINPHYVVSLSPVAEGYVVAMADGTETIISTNEASALLDASKTGDTAEQAARMTTAVNRLTEIVRARLH